MPRSCPYPTGATSRQAQKEPELPPNIQFLRHRATLLQELREYFDVRGFLEVQPPCLASDCVVDVYLDPIAVDSSQLRLGGIDLPPQMLLQTSPESAMKRLLCAGAPSIYSIGPVFRAGERGRLHNPEFTMLEWYEVGGNGESAIALLGGLVTSILNCDGFDVHSYRTIFQRILGFDPITTSMDDLRAQVADIDRDLAQRIGDDRDALLDVLMSALIQPKLGSERPVIIKNYPISQAALARAAADDAACAARFELFASGIELANGYDELTDPQVLVERAEQHNQQRISSGRQALKVRTKLQQAMIGGLPRCAGVALGVDRLLMLRTGADSIDKVMPLTIDRA
jgi:lysyl-tRNA synthetase class 2